LKLYLNYAIIRRCNFILHFLLSFIESQQSEGGELKVKKYELIYILRTDSDDETKQKIQDKLRGIIEENGEVEVFDVWGNRKLAYQIQKLTDGYYVLVKFTAGPQVPKELDRNLKIMDEAIRHMIINVTDNK